MTHEPEKESRIEAMIQEIEEIEKYCENEILVLRTRLHEHTKRKEILEECLKNVY